MKYWELFYKLSRYWITVKQWSDTVKWHSISIDSYEKYNAENNYRMRGLCKCYGLQRNDLHEARWKSTSTQLSQCQFKLLESDPEQFIFDTCKHSTTLIKKFLVTIITAKLRAWLLWNSFAKYKPYASTCALFHKNGFCWQRTNAQHQGLGRKEPEKAP